MLALFLNHPNYDYVRSITISLCYQQTIHLKPYTSSLTCFYPSSKTKYTFSSHIPFNKLSGDQALKTNREQDKNYTYTSLIT